ncbi:MAG: hypothetical protein IPG61_17610 [bacterium]|nr:hypothetical protein [bacterium]
MISEPDLQAAIALQKDSRGRKLGEVLVENHFLTEDELLKVLSAQLGFPYLDMDRIPRRPGLLAPFKSGWFMRNQALPFRGPDGALMLAVADPLVSEPPNEATRILGQSVVPCLARHVLEQAVRAMAPVPDSVARLENEGVQVQAVQRIIAEAIEQKASDIHIEPMSDRLRIRFRQDGVLVQHGTAAGIARRSPAAQGAGRCEIAERRRHRTVAWCSSTRARTLTCASRSIRPSTARRSCCDFSTTAASFWTSMTSAWRRG